MKGFILFILLWVSPLPTWVKYVFTILWVLQVMCENVDEFNTTNNNDTKKTTKTKSSKK